MGTIAFEGWTGRRPQDRRSDGQNARWPVLRGRREHRWRKRGRRGQCVWCALAPPRVGLGWAVIALSLSTCSLQMSQACCGMLCLVNKNRKYTDLLAFKATYLDKSITDQMVPSHHSKPQPSFIVLRYGVGPGDPGPASPHPNIDFNNDHIFVWSLVNNLPPDLAGVWHSHR